MKSSTRHINDWLISAVLFVAIAFLIDSIRMQGYTYPSVSPIQLVTPAPSNGLNGLASLDAIATFRGEEPEGVTFSILTLSILSSILLYLIIGPVLLYLGYKKSEDTEATFRPWYWYVGSVVCIAGLSLVITVVQQLRPNGVIQNNMQSVEKSRALDQMRDELSDVSFAIAEYEIVQDGLSPGFSLDELELAGLRFLYTVESVASDTMVTIRVEHPELDVDMQFMEIRPHSKRILRMRSTYPGKESE